MKKNIFIVLILFIILIPFNANAETIAQKRQEIANLEKQYQEQQNKKNTARNNIKTDEQSIKNKENEINVNQQKLTAAEEESAQLTVDIANGKSELENLMSAYQIASGDNVYLEYIFAASSYEDLVYRYAIMEQLMSYMNEKIDSYKDKIKKNDELIQYISDRRIELNNQINSLNDEIDSLYDDISKYDKYANDIKSDIQDAKSFLNFMINMGCKETEELNACQARVNSTNNAGWVKPLVKGKITSYFGYRISPITGKSEGHSGTDIGGNSEGTNVYPVASGTVCKIIKKASCGGNQVYVCSYVNGKKYTACYMHLLTINTTLYATVYTNTVIGTVGGGSRTKSWETCSTGAHLHLGLGTGWYGSDYTTYTQWKSHLIDARTTIGLPKMGVWWYSRY
ncbi:MAG: peptidoglycan DD-metalloendopeptidase family protein [Bacilli bacterium]|nr:peptidoglycan DD-metalloendopeptidase family protein [Bacilli bacterium]